MTSDAEEARELAVLGVFAKFGPHVGPSVRDVQAEVEREHSSRFGCSLQIVQRVLESLLDKGDLVNVDPLKELRRGARAAGSLRLSQQGMQRLLGALPPDSEPPNWLQRPPAPPILPVVAMLSCGAGVDVDGASAAVPEGETLFDVLQPDPRDQAFLTRGESMAFAGIHDGDYVVIRRIETFEDVGPRDMVVVIVNHQGVDEATLKYLRITPNEVQLIPAHFRGHDWQGNAYHSQTYTLGIDDVQIVGVLRWRIGRPS